MMYVSSGKTLKQFGIGNYVIFLLFFNPLSLFSCCINIDTYQNEVAPIQLWVHSNRMGLIIQP